MFRQQDRRHQWKRRDVYTDCTVLASGVKRNWGSSYTIDAWGNYTNAVQTKCNSGDYLNSQVDNSNRANVHTYDAAGNMKDNLYTYDAENRIVKLGSDPDQYYFYDGDGNRVAKPTTLYWRGAGMEELAESNASGQLTAEYIYFGGKRVVRIDNPGTSESLPVYYLSDHLGSTTVLANADGTKKLETMYFPYGAERWSTGSDANHYKFTGKELLTYSR